MPIFSITTISGLHIFVRLTNKKSRFHRVIALEKAGRTLKIVKKNPFSINIDAIVIKEVIKKALIIPGLNLKKILIYTFMNINEQN